MTTTELPTAEPTETTDHTADLERLAVMQVLGKDIKKTQGKLTRQQTKEAGVEAELKEEHAKTRTIETELEELHNDLATLAAGGNVERLPFGECSKPCENMRNPNQGGDSDAWKAVPVGELGIKPHIVAKLTAAGVKTFVDLEAWRSGAAGAPQIAGLGKAARQNVDDRVEAYWAAHPQANNATEELNERLARVATPENVRDGLNTSEVFKEHFKNHDVKVEGRPGNVTVTMTPKDSNGAPLEWTEDSDAGWGAANTAGVKRSDRHTAVFNVTTDGDGFKIDQTDAELLPANFNAAARWFQDVNEAKDFCAQRNRDLAQPSEDAAEAAKGAPAK